MKNGAQRGVTCLVTNPTRTFEHRVARIVSMALDRCETLAQLAERDADVSEAYNVVKLKLGSIFDS